jgi:hypothetical protein
MGINSTATDMHRPPSPGVTPVPKPHRTVWSTTAHLIGLALFMRVLTSAWAMLMSLQRPLTTLEREVPLWPPSMPLATWLERTLLAPWERWDVKYYLWIIQKGYSRDDGTAQFHPLLAWLAVPVTRILGDPLLALLLVSSLAGGLFLIAFERLARLDLPPATARVSTLLFVVAPPAFVLWAPYTEGLFLLWSVLCLLWARERRWWLAGLAGGLATLTRQQGIFLALPLAWEIWEANDRDWRRLLRAWHTWAALALVPLGLLLWLVYRTIALGDLQANFANPQALIYSLLISPSASKVVPVQAFLLPPHALWLALSKFWREPEISLLVDLILGGAWLVLLGLAWRGMRTSYRIYCVAIGLVSFSYYTGPLYPYMGLPRHLLLAFPVCIGLAQVYGRRQVRPIIVVGGLIGLLLLVTLYVLEAWVP